MKRKATRVIIEKGGRWKRVGPTMEREKSPGHGNTMGARLKSLKTMKAGGRKKQERGSRGAEGREKAIKQLRVFSYVGGFCLLWSERKSRRERKDGIGVF